MWHLWWGMVYSWWLSPLLRKDDTSQITLGFMDEKAQLTSHHFSRVIQCPQAQSMAKRESERLKWLAGESLWLVSNEVEAGTRSSVFKSSIPSPTTQRPHCFWSIAHLPSHWEPHGLCLFHQSGFVLLRWQLPLQHDCIILHYWFQKLNSKEHFMGFFRHLKQTFSISLKCAVLRWVVTDAHKFY